MGKSSRAKAARTVPSARPEWWVVICYDFDGSDDSDDSQVDVVGCATYRQALTLLQEVAPIARFMGPCGSAPTPWLIDGVLQVELFDFEGRQLWTSETYEGQGGFGLPRAEWATGRYSFSEQADRLLPLHLPPAILARLKPPASVAVGA